MLALGTKIVFIQTYSAFGDEKTKTQLWTVVKTRNSKDGIRYKISNDAHGCTASMFEPKNGVTINNGIATEIKILA